MGSRIAFCVGRTGSGKGFTIVSVFVAICALAVVSAFFPFSGWLIPFSLLLLGMALDVPASTDAKAERLRESERVKASAQERQRIMQDMHDGLGSQLLSSLMLVERGALSNEQVAQILRESIDDMRLAIDALAAEDSDLLSALGNMRFRMEPRLKAAGMEMQWDARGLPEEIDLPGQPPDHH